MVTGQDIGDHLMTVQWGDEWGFEWPGDPEVLDFEALGTSKIWKQLDYATNFRALISVMAQFWAHIDAAAVEENSRVGIDAAVGDELDDWGSRVGIDRLGMSDDLYLRAIKATVRKATGQGDPQTIYDILKIFAPAAKLTLVEAFPAGWMIWLHGLTIDEQRQAGALYDGVPSLGIEATAAIVDPAGAFQWGTASGPIEKHWGSVSAPVSEQAGFSSGVVIQ